MILAAGRGERMRPLTDHTPKPLLPVGNKPLIVWHIERLAAAGISRILINHAWLGEQIVRYLGDGTRYGVQLHYSAEPQALETAGGIVQALPLLGAAPFLVINGDIWCDWDPRQANHIAQTLIQRRAQAWLLMVNNPGHHPKGDFALDAEGFLRDGGSERLTYSGLGVYHPALFTGMAPGERAKLAPLLRNAMACGAVIGTRHAGCWVDVGTPQRLAALNQALAQADSGSSCRDSFMQI